MKISDLNESKGYWHYEINGKKITIYFNPELPRGRRWNWRDDSDTSSCGDGHFTKREAYEQAKSFAEQIPQPNQ